MAEQSIYADIARLKYPGAQTVSGEGQFAVIVHCSPRPVVLLFTDRTEAFNRYKADCGPACRHRHERVELHRPAPVFKKKAHWYRDLDRD